MESPWLIEVNKLNVGDSAVLGGNLPMFLLIHWVVIAINAASVLVAFLIFSGWHILDHLLLVTYARFPRRTMTFPIALVQAIEFGKRIPLGRYDWKLHAFCIAYLVVCVSITLAMDGFGVSGYSCLWNIKTLGGTVSLFFGVALSITNAMITIVGLAYVRRAVRAAAAGVKRPGQFESTWLQVASRCLVAMIKVAAFLHLPRDDAHHRRGVPAGGLR
ncbi:hypothetical protein H9P43_005177 [Blastocladiella emersonii ATCC 22665]|nr:hypothetical protein H9P43_005177 [Blastocladiella emersonii ATCC 22665]